MSWLSQFQEMQREFREAVDELIDKRLESYGLIGLERLNRPVVSKPEERNQKKWLRLTFRVSAATYGRAPSIPAIKVALETLGFRWVSISPGERNNGGPTYDVTVEVFAAEKAVP